MACTESGGCVSDGGRGGTCLIWMMKHAVLV